MSHRRLGGLLTLALTPGVLQAVASSEDTRQTLSWHQSYAAALAEARESGRPIFLEFRCSP